MDAEIDSKLDRILALLEKIDAKVPVLGNYGTRTCEPEKEK